MAKRTKELRCAYKDCKVLLPGTVGAGVSTSRLDSRTLICSKCGVREALQPALLATNFKGHQNDTT